MQPIAHPPATVEGWYALHQVFAVDRGRLRALPATERRAQLEEARVALDRLASPGDGGGWSAVVPLVGSTGDVMLVHFRPSLEALREAQDAVRRLPLFDAMRTEYSFLSVTELGLYAVTAELARAAAARGGEAGDPEYEFELARRVEQEQGTGHARRRLYPERPAEMPWVCFYPMSKRRQQGANWYTLTLEERSLLMYAHSKTGRRYAGRVIQVITGAIGLDAWEWGVTLFARDPLDFKRIVTDMRFDEVSAQYAEFGEFWVGKVAEASEWAASLG